MASVLADLSVEQSLFAAGARFVIGVDEVGRGALAGPVSVGAALIDLSTGERPLPPGLTDSKKLSPQRRTVLNEQVRSWALGVAVGHASPAEIDDLGLTAALRLAGLRAISQLSEAHSALAQGSVTVLLDGKHNWLAAPEQDLLSILEQQGSSIHHSRPEFPALPYPVVTRVKADLDCASVSAAAIAAKVTRDTIMAELGGAEDHYGWAGNKGYGSADHIAALADRGVSSHHRTSWSLPGIRK